MEVVVHVFFRSIKMNKLVHLMTMPAVRHRFAHRLGIFGIAIGVANLVLVSVLAALS